jgi:hypothetical protein
VEEILARCFLLFLEEELGRHLLRFEATVHNTRELRCRRGLDNFPEIITSLAGIAHRFATILDCADIAFIADSPGRAA